MSRPCSGPGSWIGRSPPKGLPPANRWPPSRRRQSTAGCVVACRAGRCPSCTAPCPRDVRAWRGRRWRRPRRAGNGWRSSIPSTGSIPRGRRRPAWSCPACCGCGGRRCRKPAAPSTRPGCRASAASRGRGRCSSGRSIAPSRPSTWWRSRACARWWCWISSMDQHRPWRVCLAPRGCACSAWWKGATWHCCCWERCPWRAVRAGCRSRRAWGERRAWSRKRGDGRRVGRSRCKAATARRGRCPRG